MTRQARQEPADVGQTLADLLCLPADGQPRESHRGYLSDRVVRGAAELVDSTGLISQWRQWHTEDNPGWEKKGGAPAQVSERAVLVVLIALAATGEPPLVSRVAEALSRRLHTQSRDLLGLPRARWDISDTAAYSRVYRRLRWLVNIIDPYPGPKRRRPTRTELELWLANLDPELVATRVKRVQHVADTLLEASARMLPADVLQRWNGNTCIDATLIRTWGRRGHPDAQSSKDPAKDKMSPEMLAGWYSRETSTGKRESYFGYEAHLAVMAANDSKAPAGFPLLVLAMSVDKPAARIGENATATLASLNKRGHPAGLLASDRAYFPNAKPEKFQLPARALGYRLCGDYRDDQLGIQAQYGGAILVEGSWYCPSMPDNLISATKDYRKEVISKKVYKQRIKRRKRYAFRPKHKTTPDGNTAWMCPARGPGATAECDLAPPTGPVNLGIPTTRTPITKPPADPDACCTNTTSITIPIAPRDTNSANIAKYYQDLPYKTGKWRRSYATLRNTIEGFNGFTKSPTEEDTEEPARRRVRGYAFQTLLVAVQILASNIRKVRAWIKREQAPTTPVKPPAAQRRNARADLSAYRPPADGPPLAQPA